MGKMVQGVGTNDSPDWYKVRSYEEVVLENGTLKQVRRKCPYYQTWSNMLGRCYNEKVQAKYPTYLGCSVCQEWLSFWTFKRWMEERDWVGKHLDKDIIAPGNKLYSPDSCVFVSRNTNLFLNDHGRAKGHHPTGVSYEKASGRFYASCANLSGKQKCLGRYDTPEEAHEAWRREKHRLAQILADQQTDERVAEALRNRFKPEELIKETD